MANEILDKPALGEALATLDGWTICDGALQRTFVFSNFVQAFGFMAKAALIAEKQNHHPDWSNSYKTVVVNLVTHSAGGVTGKDVALAQAIDKLASQ